MPSQQRLISHIFIRVNGSDLNPQVMDDLVHVTVDSNLHLPDMFVIRVHDEALEWTDRGPFDLGAEVEIGARSGEGGQEETLIVGEITALEPDFAQGTHAMLTVRGYDRSHRMHRGTHTQAFTQVTDSDLATRIAQDVGLRTDIDSTSQVYEHVLQHNQSHMAFLRSRAERIGYQVYVHDRTLHFKQGAAAAANTIQLEWGEQLQTFRPRLTLAQQIDELVVKGWDPKTKTEIIGRATSSRASPQIGESRSGGQLASSAFGSGKKAVVNRPVTSQAEADAVAQALYDQINGDFITADATCTGLPTLKAGSQVDLGALGQKFSGAYYVTSANHVYSADGDYITEFSVTGQRAQTMQNLLSDSRDAPPHAHWDALVVAIVTNNNDPDDQGRVKLKYPWMDDDVETGWARVIGVGAGDERGFYCLPEVNDEVLVAFEHSDANRPIVLGGIWNGVDSPVVPVGEAIKDGNVHTRAFKTRSGHTLTFVDDNEAKIELQTAGGHSLLLDDQNTVVQIETNGGIVFKLDDGDGSVTVQCSGKLNIEAQQDIALKAGTNMNIEATGQLKLKGATIDLN
jgi:phage protein D